MLGRGQRNEGGGPLGVLIQGAAAGVGLASESIQHHKEKKRARKQQQEQSNSDRQATLQHERASGEALLECDEAVWRLDEAQEDLSREVGQTSRSNTPGSPGEAPSLADDFICTHRSEELPNPSGRLELPVVLPQRRPRTRTRGFIKAYAPLLEGAGIDQPAFLDFIDKLNKAVEPSLWLQATNLASLAAHNLPEPISLAVSVATKMVTDAASEIHSRTKTNAFLDKTNEDYFKPRGLIALLITWKPQDSSVITAVDFDLGSTITSPSTGSKGMFEKLQSRLKSSSAVTRFEFPETAPLAFPALDELAAATTESPEAEVKKQNAIKRSGSFVTDYLDRRAVAKWAGDHPESTMASLAPKPEFRSRYADPSHPASSGDPLAFVTAGKVSAGKVRDQVQGTTGGGLGGRGGVGVRGRGCLRQIRQGDRSIARLPRGPYDEGRSPGDGAGPLLLVGGVKKLLQKVRLHHFSDVTIRVWRLADMVLGCIVSHDRQPTYR